MSDCRNIHTYAHMYTWVHTHEHTFACFVSLVFGFWCSLQDLSSPTRDQTWHPQS